RTFYPGAATVANAQPVPVSAGEERAMLDFVVPATRMETVDFVARALDPSESFRRKSGSTLAGRVLGIAPSCPRDAACRSIVRGRVIGTDGRPLRQAVVRLQVEGAPDTPPTIVTDDAGRYQFESLPPGAYRVLAMKAGCLPVWYGEQRVLGPGAT